MDYGELRYDGDEEYDTCPCCGAEAWVEDRVEERQPGHLTVEQSLTFFSCSLCGFTMQRETYHGTERGVEVFETHDVETFPRLSRQATVDAESDDVDPDAWMHLLGEQTVPRIRWKDELEARKRGLRGILN
jgi:transcription elongation factor Elf1